MTGPRRLIVCDDEADFRTYIRKVAEQQGYEVREVSDSELCVREVGDFSPDVVVLDIVMPKVDGTEIVQGLARAKYAGRVILTSGYNPHYASSAAILGEAQGIRTQILPKPVMLKDLQSVLA